MEILRINATRDGALFAGDTSPAGSDGSCRTRDWLDALRDALDRVPPDGRIVIMVHGYRFTWRPDPFGRRPHCPQQRLYGGSAQRPPWAIRPRRGAWFDGLHAAIGKEPGGRSAYRGLCIGFGWDGRRGAFVHLLRQGRSDFAAVYRGAETAGRALAGLLNAITAHRPDLRPDFLAHSLGARVVFAAIRESPSLRLGRALLLGAAEFVSPVRRTLTMQRDAGGAAAFYHVLSRANDPFDAVFRQFAPRPEDGARTLGMQGLSPVLEAGSGLPLDGWVDLQLDSAALDGFLKTRGMAPTRRWTWCSHWHFYTDQAAMGAWAAILHRHPGWDILTLRSAGLEHALAPRWSGVLPAMMSPGSLLRRGFGAADYDTDDPRSVGEA